MEKFRLIPSLFILSLLAACGGAVAPDSQPEERPGEVAGSEDELSRYKNIDHAKSVYGHYQEAAGERITFGLEILKHGRLSDKVRNSVQDLVPVPEYWISMKERGTTITEVYSEARDPGSDEWSGPASLAKFDELGRDTKKGSYALLAVRTTLDGKQSEHRALQVCWPSQGYCVVMDPVVRDLEAFASDRARLLQEGWKVDVVEDLAASPGEGVSAQAKVCRRVSNPASTGISTTWSSRTRTYKNLYGITVVSKTLGGQKVSVNCYVSGTSCKAAGSGYSYTSSCWANLGFNCDCENTGNHTGVSGSSARAWSETKCGHKNVFQGSTNITWSKSGLGANFGITWGTSGSSVDSSGGTHYETCAWF